MNQTIHREARELLRIARILLGMEFPSREAMNAYLRAHPKADRSLHYVKAPEDIYRDVGEPSVIEKGREYIPRKPLETPAWLKPTRPSQKTTSEPEENSVDLKKAEAESEKKLTPATKGAIALWGGLMAVNVDGLPRGKKEPDSPRLMYEVIEPYLKGLHQIETNPDYNRDKFDNLEDWITSGAGYRDGTKLLTRQTYNALLDRAKTTLSSPMVVYRTTDSETEEQENKNPRRQSFTRLPGAYGYEGSVERRYVLPAGTPVIFTHGFADADEIIVDTKHTRNLTPTRREKTKDGKWQPVTPPALPSKSDIPEITEVVA